MKLTKISLAALVALGAFSSVASATPLEEAIKNVDLSGFARYRYTSDKGENYKSKPAKENTSANHQFKMITNFKAAIDDNFFGVLGLRYQANDTSGHKDAKTDTTNTTGSFGVREFYLGYKYENTTITAGKQLISTYFDEDVFGTGVKIMNKDIPGVTLMAAAFDALAIDDPDVDGVLLKSGSGGLDSLNKSSNLYAIGAMGSFDPVAFKIWYANLHEVANLFAGDAALNFNINDVKLNLQAQYAHNEADSDQDKYTDANFYGVKAGVGAFGASLDAGYVNYKADDAEGGAVGTSFVALENSGKLIKPSKILNGVISDFYTNIKDKNDYWFVNAKYVYDKFGIGAGYTAGKGYGYMLSTSGNDVTRAKRNEWYGQLDYKYSKKLNFMTWYAAAKEKKDGETAKMDRIRFEAKYSF
ncbi:major outer membrane protein [Campylobacter curvus]|uniref:major outer membrane protein n=1 Tax=Campylobacter curvus TaxID=200 RepID=UPI00035D8DE8|nr:major outer membrane protein [Campylobacter curvus]QKF61062.1 major outer membrane protein [Campylobacter curvus]UEB49381.1 major outer membrane protein [Campylobacter curvus]